MKKYVAIFSDSMHLVTDPARFKALMGALPQLQMHNQRHGEIAREVQQENTDFKFSRLWEEMFLAEKH